MNPLIAFARWLSRLGWYDERVQVARERRTEDAQLESIERTSRAAETARETLDRATTTRQSYTRAGRKLTRS